jgi:hypothetical protein
MQQQGSRVSRARRKRWFNWAGLVLVAAAVAVLAVLISRNTGSKTSPGGAGGPSPGVSPTVPGRPPFFFRVKEASSAVTGKPGKGAGDDASIEIAGRLSAFYDTVFMDPNTWAHGLPDDAWTIFDADIVDRAQGDADAFTLGGPMPELTKLTVTTSSLDVRVLLDRSGDPNAAAADVEFAAVGTLANGTMVNVDNHVTFFLRPKGGLWFVYAYPTANTDVESAAGPASATPTASVTP